MHGNSMARTHMIKCIETATQPFARLLPVVLVLLTVSCSLDAAVAVDLYTSSITLCSADGGGNFTGGSMYQVNLDKLVHNLGTEAASNGGFLSSRYGNQSDEVFGVVSCFLDSSWPGCRNCLDRAPSYVTTACPYSRGAAFMFQDCVLRYSDKPFSSDETDRGHRF
jgi:hypothetical protein